MAVTITHGLNDEYLFQGCTSIFLKMLRGGFAPSCYRPSNDQPNESRDLPNFPYGKEGFDVSGGGGKVSPGVISLMYPGPYWLLYLWGLLVGGIGGSTNRPLPQGGVR
jgi:hypothetical protein